MITLLADVNIEGQVSRLVSLMQMPYWLDFWNDLELRQQRFQDAGLSPGDSDAGSLREPQTGDL